MHRNIARHRAAVVAAAADTALPMILADDTPAPAEMGFSCLAEIQAAAADAGGAGQPKKSRTLTILAYTGGLLNLAEWFYPVAIDLAGLDAGRSARPILYAHNAREIDHLLGQTSNVEITERQVKVTGNLMLSDSPISQRVFQMNDAGFQFQASVGVKPTKVEFVGEGQTATANGRTFTGPCYITRKGILGEISLCPLGADDRTSARIAATAAKGFPMSFEQWLIAKGLTLANLGDAQKATLLAEYNAALNAGLIQAAGGTGPNPTPSTPNPTPSTPTPSTPSTPSTPTTPAPSTPSTPSTPHPTPSTPAPQQAAATPATIQAGGLDPADPIAQLRARTAAELTRQADVTRIAGRHPTILAQAVRDGWDSTRTELEVLRADRPAAAPMIIAGGGVQVATSALMIAAACIAGGLTNPEKHFDAPTLDAASRRYPHGIGLQELFLEAAWSNGYQGRGAIRDVRTVLEHAFPIRAAQFSSISLPNIFTATVNKFLLAGFQGVEQTWRVISARRNVKDFRAVTSYRLSGNLEFEEVAADGEIAHGTLGEESYTNRARTYAKMLGITRQDIINDDLGVLTQIPRMIGRGGALKLNKQFWATFMNNSAFFATGNNNYLSGVTPGTNDSRLNTEGLQRAESKFLEQVDDDGNPISVAPRYLLTPTALSVTAAQIMSATEIRDNTASKQYYTTNVYAGKFTPVSSAYLSNSTITGNSALAWYLLADPNDLPVIEVVFLNGVEAPTVETAEADFNTLGVLTRGYFDFGVALQDPRAGVKSKGEA